MESSELIKKLELIFSDEGWFLSKYHSIDRRYERITPPGEAKRITSGGCAPVTTTGTKGVTTISYIETNPEQYELKFINLELLQKLYESIKTESKLERIFLDYLDKTLSYFDDYTLDTGYLSFEFLIKNDYFEDAMNALEKSAELPSLHKNLLRVLNGLLSYEYRRFPEEQLIKIKLCRNPW